MSYSIVYGRQFVKMADGRIIPLVLIGSNNCTEPYYTNGGMRERRERSWNAFSTWGANQNIAREPKELMDMVEKLTGREYQEHFVYRSKWVNDEGLIRFVKNGIKGAKTIEELSEENAYPIHLQACLHIWYKDGSTYFDGSPRSENRSEDSRSISSSEDLEEFIKAAGERIKSRGPEEDIYVILRFQGDKPVPHPKEIKRRARRERPKEYWTIMREDGVYLDRLTKNGATLSYSSYRSKCFPTRARAEKYIEEKYLNVRFTSQKKYRAEFVSNM